MELHPLRLALSVRSDFSLGESSFQVGKIVDRAKALGYTHVALVDLMTVSSMPVFAEKCKKAGVTPIVGCTLRVVDDPTAKVKDRENHAYRLKVYVKSERGLQGLFAALTKSLTPDHFYYAARLGLEDVLALEDVVVTSGDLHSLWHHPRHADISAALQQRFGDDYYAELVAINTPLFDKLNQIAVQVATAHGVPLIVTRPAMYAEPEDANATDVLRGISTNTTVDSVFLPRPHVRDLCLIDPTQWGNELKAMRDRVGYDGTVGTFKRATEIAAKATYKFAKWEPSLPKMADDEFAALMAAVGKGWTQRFSRPVWGHVPAPAELPVYKERLKFELGVLKKMGFSGYFLLVQDIVVWAKDNGIRVGPGRGSVGGSLVAYLMGITDVDPIRFGLLFERFINPDRVDLPDADLDFMSGKRHMVVDYITNKWGSDYVAGIVNFSTLGAASALRDTARMHNLQPWEYACSKQMEKEHGVTLTLNESAERVPDIEKFKNERPVIWDIATRLEGANRTLSQHAAGVVVAGIPVVNRAVVSTRGGDESLPVIQWDKTQVENFGLIKMDILGLNTLDLIDVAMQYIRERHKKEIDLLALPLDDERVLDAFGKGETTGVFQFDGAGMKKLLREMAMGGRLRFEDVCAATALFRPGPLDAGLCDRYVQVKQGATHATYDHPKLEEILKETFGVMAYQEQVMQVCRVLAGFTPGEADGVRKAIGKKDLAKMKEFKEKFVDGCVAVSAWTEPKADALWTSIEGYAAYSFNKSHSYEYSLISWVTMWLKVYYPAEFFAAAMTVIDDDTKLASLVTDAQSKGLQVLPPDLNFSSERIEIAGEDKLYAPFNAIKGISGNVAGAIVKLRHAMGGKFTMTAPASKRVITRGAKKGTTEDVAAVIDGLDPEFQKKTLGRTQVNAAARAALDRVGALHSVTGEGRAPTHPDRLKDRIELMPGFTVDMVKPDRGLNVEDLAKIKIQALIGDVAGCEGCSLAGKAHPLPRMGDKPKFMLVFDTPSWREEKAGKMLEGDAAEVVKAALKGVGLKATDGYYTSLVRSPKPKEQKVLTNEQIIGCSKWLMQEIEILKPPVIIAMGSNAVRFFAPGIKGTPADLAGKQIFRADLDATIVFGINPGSLFHDPSKIKLVEAAFDKVGELLS